MPKVTRFESLGSAMSALPLEVLQRWGLPEYDPWSGNVGYEECINLATQGDTSQVERASKLIDSLECDLDTHARVWAPSPCGAYPVVPEYLIGDPFCMRERLPQESYAPVNIYVNVFYSCVVKEHDLVTRGCAILGLLMKLQEMGRAANLHLVCGDSDTNSVLQVTLDSQPIDIGRAGFMLAHPAGTRILMFSLIRELSQRMTAVRMPKESDTKQALKLEPSDLYIESIVGPMDSIVQQPKEWIQSQLDRFNNSQA